MVFGSLFLFRILKNKSNQRLTRPYPFMKKFKVSAALKFQEGCNFFLPVLDAKFILKKQAARLRPSSKNKSVISSWNYGRLIIPAPPVRFANPFLHPKQTLKTKNCVVSITLAVSFWP